MDDNSETLKSVNNKLSVIINLLMKREGISVRDKVALLENVPISYKEAAQILGISEKHYSKEKSLLKNNGESKSKRSLLAETNKIVENKEEQNG